MTGDHEPPVENHDEPHNDEPHNDEPHNDEPHNERGDDAEIDRQVAPVLEVLAGGQPAGVAARHGIEPELLERWCDLFLAGGRDRLRGRAVGGADSLARDRFLAMTAHEFLTPLTIVKGWSETLLTNRHRLTDDQVEVALHAVSRQAATLERIARDVLDSAAVALGRFRLLVRDVDLRGLVVDAAQAGGDDRVEVAPGVAVPVVADPQRLDQVLANLVANARHHGGPGSVSMTVTAEDGLAVVRITSPGAIDPAVAYELFEPWVRGGDGGGKGLGLYVCRAIVVAHGGEIGVRGDDDRTEFWFRIPVGGPPPTLLVDHLAAGDGEPVAPRSTM